ncbi:hypothetical protein BDV28DRAFT_144890 [Aspergillus coremiiformis]|uniref:Nucleoside phosphorylase domain-containing protein n=1 Tax=Aspergillus coremiiformis TaxID=138285 RepID=A0A5N6ZGH7_9EURO|nr:hypothetical protein BDV28DRAFT_144890 [Aspergillus coremiiformis]
MSKLTRLCREDIKVAIICALSLEAVAVKQLFEWRYKEKDCAGFRKMPNDPNAYTLGRIGDYDVVLVHMSGPGKAAASTLSSHMRHSFPEVELAILVGICGGVPCKPISDYREERREIFLGDVIIGTGIIQYDYGRRIGDRFIRKDGNKDELGRANLAIRSFTTKLLSEQKDLRKEIPKYLGRILQKLDLSSPEPGDDQLIDPGYEHQTDNCLCTVGDPQVICRRRDDSCKVLEPYVHFGLIASADTVMMSARCRDEIAERDKVIGFEMEGAGIWDNIPLFVMKGVCDYADSHKRKDWQMFAAASAASCMRAVLEESPVSITPSTKDEISSEERDALESLNFPEAKYRQQEIVEAEVDTCTWVFAREEYLSWMDDEELKHHKGFLWIKGKPGAGKSTLMKHVLTNAERLNISTIIVSFFFHAQGVALEKSSIGMYRSLLYQLLRSTMTPVQIRDTFFSTVRMKQKQQDDKSEIIWTERELKNEVLTAIRALAGHRVLFLIDALDECRGGGDTPANIIKFLHEISKTAASKGEINLRICLASRHYQYIDVGSGKWLVLEDAKQHQKDMENYVKETLRCEDETIRKDICKRSAGVFLWVTLVVQSLNAAFDRGNVEAVRTKLRETPNGLNNLFRDILNRDREGRGLLIFCLVLVLFSCRPLTREELYFALCFWESSVVNREPIHTVSVFDRYILDVSKGLVEITGSNQRTVRFIHESVRDFLLDGGLDELERTPRRPLDTLKGRWHSTLAKLCFRYFSTGQFDHLDFTLRWHNEFPSLREKSGKGNPPFFSYAIRHLLVHSNTAQRYGFDQDNLFKETVNRFAKFREFYNFTEVSEKNRYKDESILYFLADKHLSDLVSLAIRNGSHGWEKSGKLGCPMGTAVYNDFRRTIRAILGCTLDPPKGRGTLEEPEAVEGMKQFLDKAPSDLFKMEGTEFEGTEYEGPTFLLKLAIERGQLWTVAVLWKTGMIDFNQPSINGYTPLARAIQVEVPRVVEYLLGARSHDFRLDVNIKTKDGDPPLKLAIKTYYVASEVTNMLLLCDRLDHSCLDGEAQNAFHWAVYHNQPTLLGRLIQLKLNINHRDMRGRSALFYAVERCNVEAIQVLLALEMVEVNSRDTNGMTPLSWALARSEKKRQESLELLLRCNKVDVNASDPYRRTPLMWALDSNNEAAIDLLLSNKVTDISCDGCRPETPLIIAVKNAQSHLVKKILQSGTRRVNVNCQDINGRTALSWAFGPWYPGRDETVAINPRRFDTSIAKLLLDSNADIRMTDHFGHTPLWWSKSYDIILAKGTPVWEVEDPHRSLFPNIVLDSYKDLISQDLPRDDESWRREILNMWYRWNRPRRDPSTMKWRNIPLIFLIETGQSIEDMSE